MKQQLSVPAIVAIVAIAVVALGAIFFKGAQTMGEKEAPKPDPSRFLPKNASPNPNAAPTQ